MAKYTLTVNDRERAVLQHAIQMMNDVTTDTLLENISFNLFLGPDDQATMSYEGAKVLRDELGEVVENVSAIRSVMTKLGCRVDQNGYSA